MLSLPTVLECIMLLCFGLSWPISVYKSVKSKSTQGKSVMFMSAILIGYISGIVAKIIAGALNYVLVIYVFNFLVVSADFVIYFINKRHEQKLA